MKFDKKSIPEWIGVDLDKTLAVYKSGDLDKYGDTYIGAPIWPMVERVRVWLEAGKIVKIFTARISLKGRTFPDTLEYYARVHRAIQDWTENYIRKRLEVTCEKDFAMVELWDDRAVGVIPNTGQRADASS